MSVQIQAVLYSFRRCPYAIRARMAIRASGIAVELREVILRNKPKQMIEISVKETVPVVQLNDGRVLDESVDIMLWALKQCDPLQLLKQNLMSSTLELIKINDFQFKPYLDKYKYSVRFPEATEQDYRQNCEFYLQILNKKLATHRFLMSPRITFADLAIFPFIRQFASVDNLWFKSCQYEFLIEWLQIMKESNLFCDVMDKYNPWQGPQELPIIF